MKKLILLFILGATLFLACKRTKPEVLSYENPKWKVEELSKKVQIYLNADSTSRGMLLNFVFDYPSAFENDSLLKEIQSAFVFAFAGDGYQSMNPEEAFNAFLKKNVDEGTEMGKMASGDGPDFSTYLKNITTSVFDTTNTIITARTVYEDYMGGAHGSHRTSYYNIDLSNGKILTDKDLFKKNTNNSLASLLQEQLNDTISKGRSITVLYPESVKPNGNFYFDNDGVVYVFNEYEIAPYSDGLIEIRLPYSKVKQFVTPKLEKIISDKTKKNEF